MVLAKPGDEGGELCDIDGCPVEMLVAEILPSVEEMLRICFSTMVKTLE
jgi:hypothetical protein